MAELGANYAVQPWSSVGIQAATNRFVWHVTSKGGLGADDQAFVDAIASLLSNAYRTLLSNTAVFHGWTAQKYEQGLIYPRVVNTANAGPGTGGVGIVPGQVAGLISWKTPLAGKRFRGRSYIPWIPQLVADSDGTPNVTYLGNLGTFADLMLPVMGWSDGTNTNSAKFVIGNLRSTFQQGVVIDYETQDGFATQRRRGYWGKPNLSPI